MRLNRWLPDWIEQMPNAFTEATAEDAALLPKLLSGELRVPAARSLASGSVKSGDKAGAGR